MPFEKGIVSIEKVQCHIKSLYSLSKLKDSFEDMGKVRVQNHGEEVRRGQGFIF
jgi:hypothetical protein